MFGKILVMLHLGLSLVFATWALVIFTNRVDWTHTKGKDGKPDGELVAKMDEHKKLVEGGVHPGNARFREARDKVAKEEARRPIERAWYGLQLEFLSSVAKDDNPARQIERDKEGNINLIVTIKRDKEGKIIDEEYPAPGADLLKMGPPQDKDGNPLKTPDGNPLVLRSLGYYSQEYNKLVAEETQQMKLRNLAAVRDADATKELKGPKGLHAKIAFEKVKQDRIKDENDEVRPLWLNTAVELKNLEELRTRLAQRLDELQKLKSKGDKLGQ